jgi:DNA-directed RNA polymerase specialized sigma24 family protein
MAVDLTAQECPAELSEEVSQHWEQKQAQIEPLLQSWPKEQRKLHLNFSCRDKGYTASVILCLPTATLIARTDQPFAEPRAAIDRVARLLMEKTVQHQHSLAEEKAQRRCRQRERDFTGAQADLAAVHEERDRHTFFYILRPLLSHLREHARRELRLANLEGEIPPGELTLDDILDELLVRAYDRWGQRPADLPVDQWLLALLHEILDGYGFHAPDMVKTKPPGDKPLAAVSKTDRRAFALWAEEGWSAEDIARLQNRPVADVRAAIDAIARSLREKLTKEYR